MNEDQKEITIDAPRERFNDRSQDRINARLTVYLEQFGEPIDETSVKFTATQDSSEDGAYPRRQKATNVWTELSFGWLDGKPVSLLVVDNRAGTKLQVIPSEEQKAKIAASTIEIGVLTKSEHEEFFAEFTTVKPGRFCAFEPLHGVRYFTRGKVEDSKFHITAIPG